MKNKNDLLSCSFIDSFLVTALCLLLFSVTFTQIHNFDFFWHLRAGITILEQKSFIYSDSFSFTAQNNSWMNFHVLFQCTTALVNKLFGLKGVTWIKTGMFFLFFGGIFFRTCKPSGVYFLLWLTAILSLSIRCMVRPELFSYGFLLLFIFFLSSEWKKWYWIVFPLLQVLMVNSHSIFMLGPLLLFFKVIDLLIKRDPLTKKYALLFLIVSSAMVVSPYGIKGALFPFRLLPKVAIEKDIFKQYISEFTHLHAQIPEYFYYGVWVILCSLTLPFLIREKKLFETQVLMFFGVLAILAVRNFNLLLITSLPVILNSGMLVFAENRLKNKDRWLKVFVLSVAVFYSALFFSNKIYYTSNRLPRFGAGLNDTVFSRELPSYLSNFSDYKAFNSMSLGGYLAYFVPDKKVFYDGRLDVYGKQHFKIYLSMISNLNAFLNQSREWKINMVILNHSIKEGDALMDLAYHPQWMIGYLDLHAIVFLKKESFPDHVFLSETDIISNLDNYVKKANSLPAYDRTLMLNVFRITLKRIGFVNAAEKVGELIKN